MSISASELAELRDALIRARANGAREVAQGNERVRYGSDAEMAEAIASLERRIAAAQGRRPAVVRFHSAKGV